MQDDDFIIEESFHILDLGAHHSAAKIKAASTSGMKLIGMDTPSPILRIGTMDFQGRHEETLGTDVIFASSKSKTLKLQAVSNVRTRFVPVAISKKHF